jgi:zinc/manganese transport system substrate-binding protein
MPRLFAGLKALLAALLAAAPAAHAQTPAQGHRQPDIAAVGIENQYADVIAQVGGQYVHAQAIVTDPNTDPHSFEASPAVARQIAAARLVVLNGVGYDDWAKRIIAAARRPGRAVITVQALLGLPGDTPNPHLWYDPRTMPAVAQAVADDLAALRPAQAAYFHANAARFVAALKPWMEAIAVFRSRHDHAPVAVTEPVANFLLQAMGCVIRTPGTLQKAIMDGNDPSPQDVAAQNALLARHQVGLLVYNQQVTDPLTNTFLGAAKAAHVPVVGVTETMPTPGYTYQSWMLAEVSAMENAFDNHRSTPSLR